jgi:hypothetical protein
MLNRYNLWLIVANSQSQRSDFDKWHDSNEGAWTDSDHDARPEQGRIQPSAVRSRESVRFTEGDNLRTFPPRPIDE